ncbi:hypothetical protein ACEYYB_11050 [Paracoccus sp. p4-l81]
MTALILGDSGTIGAALGQAPRARGDQVIDGPTPADTGSFFDGRAKRVEG